MKIGCSSESFARSIEAGELTQLEWLDVCANELEVDGVAFTLAHFPRTDAEYLAQLKKMSADLGLTVAAVTATSAFWTDAEPALDIAVALGAPIVIAPALPAGDGADAWGAFAEAVKRCSRAGKARNITLAVRNAPDTLCPAGDGLRRLAKDVDSSWLRYAPDAAHLAADDAHTILPKSVAAVHTIAALASFAAAGDRDAEAIVTNLARFRAFVIIDAQPGPDRVAFHAALDRFAALRSRALAPR